jgi:hypothetical protein
VNLIVGPDPPPFPLPLSCGPALLFAPVLPAPIFPLLCPAGIPSREEVRDASHDNNRGGGSCGGVAPAKAPLLMLRAGALRGPGPSLRQGSSAVGRVTPRLLDGSIQVKRALLFTYFSQVPRPVLIAGRASELLHISGRGLRFRGLLAGGPGPMGPGLCGISEMRGNGVPRSSHKRRSRKLAFRCRLIPRAQLASYSRECVGGSFCEIRGWRKGPGMCRPRGPRTVSPSRP